MRTRAMVENKDMQRADINLQERNNKSVLVNLPECTRIECQKNTESSTRTDQDEEDPERDGWTIWKTMSQSS